MQLLEPSPFSSLSTSPSSLRNCSTPTFCSMEIWFCFTLDRNLLRLHSPWGAVPSPSKARPISCPHSTHLRLAWLGLGSAYLGAEDYYISYPASRLVSSARWQRYAAALIVAPMLESSADSSARVDLVCRWSPFSPRALSMTTCEKAILPQQDLWWNDFPPVRAPMQPSFILKTHLASCPSHWLVWLGWWIIQSLSPAPPFLMIIPPDSYRKMKSSSRKVQ